MGNVSASWYYSGLCPLCQRVSLWHCVVKCEIYGQENLHCVDDEGPARSPCGPDTGYVPGLGVVTQGLAVWGVMSSVVGPDAC